MPHEPVRPAYARIDRHPIVTFDRFHPDRWSGVVHLTWQVAKESPVAIGAGRLTVRSWEERGGGLLKIGKKRIRQEPETKHEVLAEIVRRGPANLAVLPGSSLKGAVRQVFELLSPSCDPHDKEIRCQVSQDDPQPHVCPACSLFGGLGLSGRLAFLEAEPLPKSCWYLIAPAARGWGKQKPVPGTYRVYGSGQARNLDGSLRNRDDTTWAVHGTFGSRVRIKDSTDDELGLLFAALGLGAEAPPSIRIGGRKFDGFGGCSVTVADAVQRRPAPSRRAGAEAHAWAEQLAVDAIGRDADRQRAFLDLHRALRSEGGTHALPS